MKRWMRALALALALLLGTAALAEDMTLPEKIAAAEEEVLQWLEDGGAITEDEARRAAEYLLTRGEALFANAGELTEEEAVLVSQAVTYLEQACARGGVAVNHPVVRLCTSMRTAVEQLYKLGLAWEDSGVESYAVAFESARDEMNADMDGNIADLCDRAAILKARLEQVEAETLQWLEEKGGVAKEELEQAIEYLREHAAELEKDIAEVSDEVAEELTRALVCVEAAVSEGLDEAGEAVGDMAEQVREGVDALWKEGKTWAEAGMDEVKAAYETAREAVESGWQQLTAAIGEMFG